MESGGLKGFLASLRGKKGKGLFLLLLALAVLLLVFGGSVASSGKPETDTYAERAERYRKEAEARVTALCRQVKGVSNVTAAVVLAAGEEYVYAEDDTPSGGTGTVTAGGSAVLVTRKTPAIAGIAVVCTGGGDPAVAGELSRLLHAAFGVPYSRICVTEAKSP